MGSSSSISAAGLAVAAAGVSVAAANIANVETPGYVPATLAQAEGPDGGVSARVVKAGDPLAEVRADRALLAGSGVDLVHEVVGQEVAARSFEANLKSLQTSFDLEGELLKALR